MTWQHKQWLVGAFALVAISVSAFWIYKKSFVRPLPQPRWQSQNSVGQVLAEETIKLVGRTGQIVVVNLEEGHSSELDTYYETFKDGLKESSIKILRTDTVSGSKASQYGPGFGISGRRFAKVATTYPQVDAIVSLVGLPDSDDEELKTILAESIPKVIAFSRSSKDVEVLIQNKLIDVAIVPRVTTRNPSDAKPSTPRQWFDQQFDILRAAQP